MGFDEFMVRAILWGLAGLAICVVLMVIGKYLGQMLGVIVVAFVAMSSVANASDYTQRDGLYWKDGTAYTRSIEYYTHCGKRYSRYAYTPTKVDYRTTIQNLTYKTPKWRDIFAEALKERSEEESFEAAMKAAGFDYGNQQNAYQQGVATQSTAYGGSSIYGYPTASYSQSIQFSNPLPIDTNILLNRYANAVDNLQQIEAQSLSGLRDLSAFGLEIAKTEAASKVEVARLHALPAMIEASKNRSITQTTTQTGPVVPPQPGQFQASGVSLTKTKCGSCHGGESPAGGITLDGSPISSALASASIASAYLKAGKLDQRTADAIGGAEGMLPMPKGDKPALTDQELDQLAAELRSWVQ